MTISALILVTVAIGEARPWPTIALMVRFMADIGFLYGHSAMLATTGVRHTAGTGSAILGFAQYTAGALASPLVGVSGHSSAVPMGIVMFCASAAAAVSHVDESGEGTLTPP